MNVDDIAPQPRPEPKRDRYGRYLMEGQANTRATTIAGALDDRFNLEWWGHRSACKGMTLRKDLYAQAASLHVTHDRKEFNKVCEQAIDASKEHDAANLGTALHRFVEQVITGQRDIDSIPDMFQPRVRMFFDTITRAGIEVDPEASERIVAYHPNDTLRIAGTADFLPAHLATGKAVVADLKTGSSVDFLGLSVAIQLAVYANHTHTYDVAKDKLGPRVDVDRDVGYVIHLPSEGETCDIWAVDIAQGFQALACAIEVRGWRNEGKKLLTPYKPLNGGSGGIGAGPDWIRDRIRVLEGNGPAVTALITAWPEAIPQPLPDELDTFQLAAMDQILTQIEARFEIGFPKPQPGTEPTKQKAGK